MSRGSALITHFLEKAVDDVPLTNENSPVRRSSFLLTIRKGKSILKVKVFNISLFFLSQPTISEPLYVITATDSWP